MRTIQRIRSLVRESNQDSDAIAIREDSAAKNSRDDSRDI